MHNRRGKQLHGGERPVVSESQGAVITVPRHELVARKLHGIKSGGALPVVKPELVHAIVQESDRPEHRFLAGTFHWADRSVITAQGAGNFGYIQYINPVGSGVISVIEGIYPFTSVSVLIGVSPSVVGGGAGLGGSTTSVVSSRDTRTGVTGQAATARLTYFNTVGTFWDGKALGMLQSGTNNWVPLAYVLGPGTSFRVAVTTANTAFDGFVMGYERIQEPTED